MSSLGAKYQNDLDKIKGQVSAITTYQEGDENFLIVASMEMQKNPKSLLANNQDMKCYLQIYKILEANLQLIFTCADANEQLPILPNQKNW